MASGSTDYPFGHATAKHFVELDCASPRLQSAVSRALLMLQKSCGAEARQIWRARESWCAHLVPMVLARNCACCLCDVAAQVTRAVQAAALPSCCEHAGSDCFPPGTALAEAQIARYHSANPAARGTQVPQLWADTQMSVHLHLAFWGTWH